MIGPADRLRQALDALQPIERRLSFSLSDDRRFFPVSASDLKSDDHEAIKARDAFLQRFGQATDHVLRKLFRRMQAAITGSLELLTVRELFNALHRVGLVESPQVWMEFIELRNRLIHDYALDPDELATALNDAWYRAPILLQQIESARAFARSRGLLGDV